MLSKPLSTEPHSQSFWFLNLPPIRASSDKLTHVCTSRGQGWRSVEVSGGQVSLLFSTFFWFSRTLPPPRFS